MIQDQLVDYISSQLKLGIAHDTIKAALTGAGWPTMDVDDSFKKVEGATTPAVSMTQPAKPAATVSPATFSGSGNSFSSAGNNPVKKPGTMSEPQTIRVSDLVSASSASLTASPAASQPKVAPVEKKPFFVSGAASVTAVSAATKSVSTSPAKTKHGFSGTIVWIVLTVLFALLAGYFYYENSTLSAQVGAVNSVGQNVNAQVASLQAQVQNLTASSTALANQNGSLVAANQELTTNLSFLVAPTGTTSQASSTNFIVTGSMVSGGKPTYVITTTYGIKIYVKNSADTLVRTFLQPIVDSSSGAEIAGTHIPGTANVTVTGVNGVSTASITTTTSLAATTTP
jgi:cell division protein FtsB